MNATNNMISPSDIQDFFISVNEVNISQYRVDMIFIKESTDEEIKISFTDEEGYLEPDNVARLYKILFTFPDYEHQNLVGIFYENKLVAVVMVEGENNARHYITWDSLGILVANCYEGMTYQKEMDKKGMKILIPGNKPKTYSFICDKCGCFFEMKEFEHGITIQDNKAYTTCPCCESLCTCVIKLKDTSFVKYI